MKTRDRGYKYHNTWKTHLQELPRIENFPTWQGTDTFACLLIPVFSFDGSTEFIEKYVAKSAAWALKTWKDNSDAQALNIPCYIYVEADISEAAIDILRRNGVPKENIKVAAFPNTMWLTKCLQPLFDKTLAAYKYLVVADIDTFALSNNTGVLPFFGNLKGCQSKKGVGCKVFGHSLPQYWMPHLQQVYEYTHKEPFVGNLQEKWISVIEVLTGQQGLKKYLYDYEITPWTGTMVLEAAAFSDKDWLETACKILGNDEGVLYAWSKLKGNTFWDLDDIEIAVFTDILKYLNAAYESQVNVNKENKFTFMDVHYTQPCLLHHFASIDHKFYQTLGIYP